MWLCFHIVYVFIWFMYSYAPNHCIVGTRIGLILFLLLTLTGCVFRWLSSSPGFVFICGVLLNCWHLPAVSLNCADLSCGETNVWLKREEWQRRVWATLWGWSWLVWGSEGAGRGLGGSDSRARPFLVVVVDLTHSPAPSRLCQLPSDQLGDIWKGVAAITFAFTNKSSFVWQINDKYVQIQHRADPNQIEYDTRLRQTPHEWNNKWVTVWWHRRQEHLRCDGRHGHRVVDTS